MVISVADYFSVTAHPVFYLFIYLFLFMPYSAGILKLVRVEVSSDLVCMECLIKQ